MRKKIPKAVILGAGISGLSLGWYLKKRFADSLLVTILEKSSRPGGWIQTQKEEGFLFEKGPHSIRTAGSGKATLQLIEDLELQNHVIPASLFAKKRFLYTNGGLKAIPSSPLSLLFSSWGKEAALALWRDYRAPEARGEESIHDFAARRFGSFFSEYLFDPLVSGIYAGDPKCLSLPACFPYLAEWEKKHRTILKGLLANKQALPSASPFVKEMMEKKIISFKNGMKTLPEALAKALEKDLQLNRHALKITLKKDAIELFLNDGSAVRADYLFSALPAYELAPLLGNLPEIQQSLLSIPYASVAVINIGYRHKVLKQEGFGYLIPAKEKESILGALWDSSVFPQQNQSLEETRLTVLVGGARMKDFHLRSVQNIKDIALESLSRHLGIEEPPDKVLVQIAERAIPQYPIGHLNKMAEAKDKLAASYPSFYLLGSFYQGVSVNDCIQQSQNLAAKITIDPDS